MESKLSHGLTPEDASSHPAWQWDEHQQVGTDYRDAVEVERYEQRMGQFRDLAAEDAAILAALELPAGANILEIGTGTGHFARAAAAAGHRVTAWDVSQTMLQYAEMKAKAQGLAGIEFRHGGFLTLSVAPGSFAAAVSVTALHHLPDFWKAVALHNIHRALKPNGRFLLGDVVFACEGQDYQKELDKFVLAIPELTRPAAIGHVTREFSTLTWIMEGLLQRAGFRILSVTPQPTSFVQYLCRAEPSSQCGK